ncbi:MAG: class I SAM-dependent methyltransferase, partial [Candidatus Aminicenantales bacterium]
PPLQIFLFQKNEQEVAVCWKRGIPLEYTFSKKICRVLDRDGLEIKTSNNKIIINESPQYVFLNQDKGESLPLERRTLPLHSVGFKEDEVEDYERRRYRGLDQRIVDWRERRILKNLLKRINRHSTRVLDIPSGYGRFSSLLLEHCFILTSCDLSFYMVKRALTKKRPSGRQWGVVADAKKGLPFKKGSFTLLLSIRFFHHLHSHQEREFILREFACLSSRWLIISYYKRTIFHLIQRKFRRKLKRSRTRIKMLPGHELKEEIAQTGWRLLREYSLCKGLHAQHIALLEKI